MKQFKLVTIGLALIVLILSFSNYYLYSQNRDIKNQITQKDLSYKQLEDNFKLLKKNYEGLNTQTENLQNANMALKNKSSELLLQMQDSQADIDKTIDKLNNFEQTVKDSISWFKKNSNIVGIGEYNSTGEQLKNCIKRGASCKIDTSCIYQVNKFNGIHYTDDLAATGKDDFLKDLKLIFYQKGGDCEDFSVLFNAEYNYLTDECLLNYTRKDIIPIVENKEIAGNYMYSVCGSFDPGKVVNNWGGHCLNAISKNYIINASNVYDVLKDAELVEPQNGRYMGQLGVTSYTNIFDTGVNPTSGYRLDMVITPNDLYIFYAYGDKITWRGYHDFLQDAESMRGKISK